MKNLFKSVWMAIFVMVVGMVFTHGQAPVVTENGNAAVTADGSAASRTLSPTEAAEVFSSRRHARLLAEGDGITVKVYASVGPRKDAPEYAEFAGSFLLAAFNDVYPTGEPSKVKFLSLGRKFEPGNLMGGWTIWFATVIERAGKPFMPTNLTSQISSSASDIFGKIELYNNPENVYGMTSRGQVTDQNGIKTLITGGRWSESLVTKFAFLGTANKTMNDPTQSIYDNNVRWMMGFPNFILDCKWAIKENGVIAGIGGITLETRPFIPEPPTLVITRDGNGIKVSSPDLPTSISADVLQSPNWSVVGTITGTQALAIPAGQSMQLFRLRVNN